MPNPAATRWLRLVRLFLAAFASAVAVAVSFHLWSQGATGVSGCDAFGGGDCDAALASRWAKVLEVPVSLLGGICYASLLGGVALIGAGVSMGWRLVELMIPAAVGAAAWFVGLQVSGATSFCPFCLTIHAAGVIACVVLLFERLANNRTSDSALPIAPVATASPSRRAEATPAAPPLGLPTLLGMLGVVAIVATQIVAPPQLAEIDASELSFAFDELRSESAPESAAKESDQTEEQPAADQSPEVDLPTRRRNGSRELSLLRGQLKIDTYEYPVLGSPDAPHIAVELMDYSCPHCREFAPMIDEAQERFDGQVAVVVIPVATELLCNKYVKKVRPKARGGCRLTRVSLALAEAAPERFESFHHWLLDADELRSWGTALAEAREVSGGLKVEEIYTGNNNKKQLQRNIELYAVLIRAGVTTLPTQILGDKVVPGLPASVDQLCETWEEHLGASLSETE